MATKKSEARIPVDINKPHLGSVSVAEAEALFKSEKTKMSVTKLPKLPKGSAVFAKGGGKTGTDRATQRSR